MQHSDSTLPTPVLRSLLAAAALVGIGSCSPGDDGRLRFPDDFIFGTAVAGFQVEMGCPTVAPEECEDRNSDWYQWITDERVLEDSAEFFLNPDPPSTGPGFYELYEEDFDRVRDELGLGAFRLSIEWSRVFPEPTFDVEGHEELKKVASARGLAFYRAQLQALKDRGIVPLVTLNHYTLPLWIHDGLACHEDIDNCEKRGWLDPRTPKEIAKYSGFVARELGDLVDLWATQNEPLAVILSGYLQPGPDRTNPPGVFLRQKKAKAVTMALIRAHGLMYDAVRENDTVDADGNGKPAEIGLVASLAPVHPRDPDNELDEEAARNVHYLFNQLFLDGVALGLLDEEADGNPVRKPELENRMDWIGVNSYSHIVVEGMSGPALALFSPLSTFNPLSIEFPWNEYPKAIYDLLMFVTERYGLPIYVTENGTFVDEVEGEARQERVLVENLTWMHRAMEDGADVRGYFWWTLVDNYEWNHGMRALRFGLYELGIDDPNKPRTLRPVGKRYRRIVSDRALSPEDLEDFPQAAHP